MKKKSLFLLALSAMVMGGCSKSEIDDGTINSTNAISFSTSANKLTKAPALSNNNATEFEFGVYAYQTGQDNWSDAGATKTEFMVNQMVEYDGAWTYTPMKYWPNSSGEKISFFAYMPYSTETVASIPSGSTVPQIEFTQNMDAEKMLDLTVAKVLDQEKTTSAVVLPFEHVSTRLNFSAKVDHDLTTDLGGTSSSTYVYVRGLRVLGSTNNPNSKLYSKAIYVMSDDATDNGEWDYTTAPTVADADLDVATILNTTDYSLGLTPTTVTAVKLGQTTTPTPLLKSGEFLFFIPPSANGVESEDDIQLNVDYSIITADATIADGIAKSDATATMSLPNGSLQEGVAYNIVMTIGVDKVIVDAEAIEDWTAEETVYTEYEATTATQIETLLSDAFTKDLSSVIVSYVGNDNYLDIEIPDAASNSDMSITLDLKGQTGDVTITTADNYTGKLYINAPDATVTLDGTTYTGLTSATAANTLIIPAGVTVDGLIIEKGNVTVSGTIKGDVVRSANNTDATTTITIMPDAIYNEANIAEDITVNNANDLTEDGIYYSLDGGAWTKYSATSDIDGTKSYSAIKLITVGSSTIDNTHVSTMFSNNALKSVDLSGAAFNSTELIWWNTAPTNTQLEEFYFPESFASMSGTFKGVTTLKKVVLPESCTTITSSAFASCTALESINLEKVVEINHDAFSSCTNLGSIDISSATTLGAYAFNKCSSIEDVKLGDGIEIITSSCFYNCTSLTSINLENIKIIYSNAFEYCASLESVDLSSLVNTATISETEYTTGITVFKDCTSLNSVTLGEGLTEITTSFFEYCTSLKSIDLSYVKKIGYYSFQYSGLESVTLDEGLESLQNYAFRYTALKEVTIPSTVTYIASNQFAYTNLESITFADRSSNETPIEIVGYLATDTKITSFKFPENCGTLGNHFLFNTTELKEVDFNNVTNLPRACFYKSGLESLYIPNYIDLNSKAGDDGYTFLMMPNLKTFEIADGGKDFTARNKILYGNPVLEKVTFPSTLKGFTDNTLAGCPMLSTIVCYATTVPTATETDFGYIDENGSNLYVGNAVADGSRILYVPASSVDAYKAATITVDDPDSDVDGQTIEVTNYWKTVLIDKCHFVVKSIDDMQ